MESTRRADQDIERLTQCLVGGMLDEAFAENQQGFGNALAQTFAGFIVDISTTS